MNSNYIQPVTGQKGLPTVIKLLVVVCLVVASFSNGHEAQGGGIPSGPPKIYAFGSKVVRVGGPTFNLYLLATPGYGTLAGMLPVIAWNGQALATSVVKGEFYKAIVPADLISVTQVATLTTQAPSSVPLSVIVTDTLPPESPLIFLDARPGRLEDGINNVVRITVTDSFNTPVVADTLVVFESSDGSVYDTPIRLRADVTTSVSFSYRSRATETVTPTVAVTAHVFSPIGYSTSAITLTGVFTRYGSFLPVIQ
jgi:hypothetical protein